MNPHSQWTLLVRTTSTYPVIRPHVSTSPPISNRSPSSRLGLLKQLVQLSSGVWANGGDNYPQLCINRVPLETADYFSTPSESNAPTLTILRFIYLCSSPNPCCVILWLAPSSSAIQPIPITSSHFRMSSSYTEAHRAGWGPWLLSIRGMNMFARVGGRPGLSTITTTTEAPAAASQRMQRRTEALLVLIPLLHVSLLQTFFPMTRQELSGGCCSLLFADPGPVGDGDGDVLLGRFFHQTTPM